MPAINKGRLYGQAHREREGQALWEGAGTILPHLDAHHKMDVVVVVGADVADEPGVVPTLDVLIKVTIGDRFPLSIGPSLLNYLYPIRRSWDLMRSSQHQHLSPTSTCVTHITTLLLKRNVGITNIKMRTFITDNVKKRLRNIRT